MNILPTKTNFFVALITTIWYSEMLLAGKMSWLLKNCQLADLINQQPIVACIWSISQQKLINPASNLTKLFDDVISHCFTDEFSNSQFISHSINLFRILKKEKFQNFNV